MDALQKILHEVLRRCFLLILLALAPGFGHVSAAVTVDVNTDIVDGDTTSVSNLNSSKGADGLISLREALFAANNTAGADTINFSIATGLQTILPTSALPQLTDRTVIDGTTQPGWVGQPLIELQGSSAGAATSGLLLSGTSDGSTVRGLVIKRFTGDGIRILSGADSITVAGCWIGCDTSGLASRGNGDDGIEILGAYATIGGTGPNDGNVISNSNDEGINITGAGATGNIIIGNIIGLEPDGTSGSGNGDVGIAVLSTAGSQVIGGATSEERNIISMNYEGIEINTSGNVVIGNYIGTDATGTLDRGNRSDDGIEIQAGADNNKIGDTIAGAGNIIAFNQRHGVNIVSGTGNSVLGNSIHSNDLRGIDLGNNGVTANDGGDGDTGANDLQNYPVLDSAKTNGTDTVWVYGSLNSAVSTDFRLEFFSSASADATGFGEGETYVGNTTVTTNTAGDAKFAVTLEATVPTGAAVSATATDPWSNTSEFSDTALTVTGTVLSVSVSDPSFTFGTMTLDTWLTPQSSVIVNDGNVAEDFLCQISQFTDGSSSWEMGATVNGADSIRAQWSTVSNTGPWTEVTAYASDFTIASNVAVSDSVTLWLRIQTPTVTSSFDEYSSAITVTATED